MLFKFKGFFFFSMSCKNQIHRNIYIHIVFHKTFTQLCSTGITPDFATTRAKNYDPIGTSFHTWILTKTYIFVYIHSVSWLSSLQKKLKKEILTGFQIISGKQNLKIFLGKWMLSISYPHHLYVLKYLVLLYVRMHT